MTQIDKIIAYEQGDMDEDDIIDLFQDMLDSGIVWQLQGSYGRTANQLIQLGYIQQGDPK